MYPFMYKCKNLLFSIILFFVFASIGNAQNTKKVFTQEYVKNHYTKKVYHIEMRDGVKLYTVVYAPKDHSEKYPFLMKRTPYSCRPYEDGVYPRVLNRNPFL